MKKNVSDRFEILRIFQDKIFFDRNIQNQNRLVNKLYMRIEVKKIKKIIFGIKYGHFRSLSNLKTTFLQKQIIFTFFHFQIRNSLAKSYKKKKFYATRVYRWEHLTH